MKWKTEYATGVQRIDEQHQMIFKMADDFRAVLDEERGGVAVYSTLLDTLTVYCRGHFSFEERCMDEHQCPVAERNKEAHGKFVEVLSGFKYRFAVRGYDSGEARRLVDIVDEWLKNHICSIDAHLRECVNK